jgi:soluble lytic murein transglycosylase-like protein
MSIADSIFAEAQRQGVDPSLALEVARAESSLNPNAVGDDGQSIGLFQLKLSTAAQLGVDPYDVAQNIQGGITYLRQLLAQFGDPAKAVAAYNCGAGCMSKAIARYGVNWFVGIPSSTQGYVNKILGNVQTAYTPAFNPAPSFPAPSSVLTIPPAAFSSAPVSTGASLWQTLAIAAAVILGLGFVLSES